MTDDQRKARSMNELEAALAAARHGNDQPLEFYLDVTPLLGIRKDVEEIREKAADQSLATQRLQVIKSILADD